jgi:hypothetical protein
VADTTTRDAIDDAMNMGATIRDDATRAATIDVAAAAAVATAVDVNERADTTAGAATGIAS